MTDVARIRGHLDELTAEIEEMQPFADSPAIAREISSLRQIEADLVADLDAARRPTLELVLNGAPVLAHEMRVDALSKVLHSLQESISAVAQSLTGRATAQSSIPGPIRDATVFRFAAVAPGSFAATLRGPQDESEQEALFEDSTATLLDAAVDQVLSIVSLASGGGVDDDPIVAAVLPLGSRAFKHLSDLSSAFVDEEMTADIEWRTPSEPESEVRRVRLDKENARRLEDVLGRNRISERETDIIGRLGTVSDLRSRVEIATDAEVVPAKVIEEVVPRLGALFTQRVRARVLIRTARSVATGREQNSYTVLGLEPEPEEPTLDEG